MAAERSALLKLKRKAVPVLKAIAIATPGGPAWQARLDDARAGGHPRLGGAAGRGQQGCEEEAA
jgi:hypothetical protein